MKTPLSLTYREMGSGNRPVILFLHGFMGSGEDWASLAESLQNDFRCLMVDLPGHGKNPLDRAEASWSMSATAAAVLALLKQRGDKPVYLVGYSMGGRLGLYLSLNYPAYFRKVVLESASPGLEEAAERLRRRQRDKQLARLLETGNLRDFLRQWYQQPLFQPLSVHPQFESMRQRRLNNDPRALARSLREMGTAEQPSLWERLPDNKIPHLLVVGEKDAKFRTIAREMTSRGNLFDMVVIPGCGHTVHLENGTQFAARLTSFFEV